MSGAKPRRAWLQRLAALPLLAAVRTAAAPADPDAELRRLYEAWLRNQAEQESLVLHAQEINHLPYEDQERFTQDRQVLLFDESRAIESALATTPARTLRGLEVKARVAQRFTALDCGELERAIFRDILAVAAAAGRGGA